MIIKKLKLGNPHECNFEAECLELRKDPEKGYYVTGRLRNRTEDSLHFFKLDVTLPVGNKPFSLSAYYEGNIEFDDESLKSVQKPNHWPPRISLDFTTDYFSPSSTKDKPTPENTEYCFIKIVAPIGFPSMEGVENI